MTYRHDIAIPAELAIAQRHFASGINHPGEVDGHVGNIGITAGEAREPLLQALEMIAGGATEVFVDSGAFSEVKFSKTGERSVVKPITDAAWDVKFELYERVAHMFRTRARVVAPDCVGDQIETLRRLEKFAPRVAAIAALRAEVIVPVQKGELPMSTMYARACELLGLRRAPIAGIPMKKDATSLEDLAELVASMPWYDCRFHLLGIGPKARGGMYNRAIRTILAIRPNAEITTDSALTPSIVGRQDRGKPCVRPLTRYQDEARASGVTSPREVKAYGLARYSLDQRDDELEAMFAAGWFDVELYDTIEEAIADHVVQKRDRAALRTATPSAPDADVAADAS